MASKASAVWTGSLKEGKGTISTATGVLSNANYSFATRFEGADSGTTPEELIAAAHASCFSMALGAQLGGAGFTPDKIETKAAVTLAKTDTGFAITKIALTTTATVPGATKGRLPHLQAVRKQHGDRAGRQAGLKLGLCPKTRSPEIEHPAHGARKRAFCAGCLLGEFGICGRTRPG
jgi:lipoyl-dependent peroxiredoxin